MTDRKPDCDCDGKPWPCGRCEDVYGTSPGQDAPDHVLQLGDAYEKLMSPIFDFYDWLWCREPGDKTE